MKINWGTGIVIGMLSFIAFIMYFVVNMLTDTKYDYDLVTEEYYEKELLYQEEIDAETNSRTLTVDITGEKTKEGWLLKFPENINYKEIEGSVFLYRPSNKQLDYNMPIKLSSNYLLIPDNRLLDGRWNITVDWKYKGTAYLYKKSITY